MNFHYQIYTSIPESTVVEGINILHRSIFGTTDNLSDKLARKPHILIITAMDSNSNKVIGYKIGYEIDRETFYSWLGGVDIHYRENGIAAALMDKQHAYLREKGYKIVRTKTMNKWRNMLILNIKFGFDVIETYTDENGLHKIILEKKMI